jgi:hypothetical protein
MRLADPRDQAKAARLALKRTLKVARALKGDHQDRFAGCQRRRGVGAERERESAPRAARRKIFE